jgi:hypothetical protein
MLIIDKGKKIKEGMVKDLFDPEDNYVFITTGEVTKAITLIEQSSLSGIDIRPADDGFQIKMKNADIAAFNNWLVKHDIAVTGIRSMHNLEHYFIQVTTSNQHVETYAS